MDNVCHTLLGVAASRAGFHRTTRLATSTLAIASNLPDIDVLVFATDTPSVAFRRGWTHGVPAQIVLSIGFALVMWLIARRKADGPRSAHFGWLLALSFYGKSPSPNEGDGIGRAVREINADGTFGPIHFIRLNAKTAFPAFKPPYPLYTASPDKGFIAACDALLANKLMTAQWWEEEQHDDSGFYRVRGKALSYVTRPDGSTLGIWKNRLVSVTTDKGGSWTPTVFAGNMPNNGSKYWLQRTADDRYGLVLNPTNRNRLSSGTSP